MKLAWLFLAACSATSAVPPARFANAPPVQVVNDRRDVPAPPARRRFMPMMYKFDGAVRDRFIRGLSLPPQQRALGVNSLDEVPDSTWFTNRIGVRELTADEVRMGPNRVDNPELHKPWTVRSTKVGGTEVGFVITDARGEKFLLKFDPRGHPEEETATHIVVDRLLWACGYNTTEDFIVDFRPEDLVLAPDAYAADEDGNRSKLDAKRLDSRLALVDHQPDGVIRGLASRWIAGKLLGGHPGEGVRDDDPNDRIPHELRRDLRGLYTLTAWLDHVDIQEGNFVDAWVADADDPHVHFVKHYLIDFGKSLGVMASTGYDPRRSFEYVIDFGAMGRSLVTAGLTERAWERRGAPAFRGTGIFDATTFDPGGWKPDWPAYVPFIAADRYDKFWATKILMRLRPEHIRAAVDAARYSDPRAAEYVAETLIARQRATGAYWFARVSPLDRFAVAGDTLCFDDLSVAYGFDTRDHVTYEAYDREAQPISTAVTLHVDGDGHVCTRALPHGRSRDGYTIVDLATEHGHTFVHVAVDPSGTRRVIGVFRP